MNTIEAFRLDIQLCLWNIEWYKHLPMDHPPHIRHRHTKPYTPSVELPRATWLGAVNNQSGRPGLIKNITKVMLYAAGGIKTGEKVMV